MNQSTKENMKKNLSLLALLAVSTAWGAESDTVKAMDLTAPADSSAKASKKGVKKQKRAEKRAQRKENHKKRIAHAISKMEEAQTLINSDKSAEEKVEAIKGKIAAASKHLKTRQDKMGSKSAE